MRLKSSASGEGERGCFATRAPAAGRQVTGTYRHHVSRMAAGTTSHLADPPLQILASPACTTFAITLAAGTITVLKGIRQACRAAASGCCGSSSRPGPGRAPAGRGKARSERGGDD